MYLSNTVDDTEQPCYMITPMMLTKGCGERKPGVPTHKFIGASGILCWTAMLAR